MKVVKVISLNLNDQREYFQKEYLKVYAREFFSFFFYNIFLCISVLNLFYQRIIIIDQAKVLGERGIRKSCRSKKTTKMNLNC